MLITIGLLACIAFRSVGRSHPHLAPELGEQATARVTLTVTWLSSLSSVLALIAWIAGGAGSVSDRRA